jgi:hypothetical protein
MTKRSFARPRRKPVTVEARALKLDLEQIRESHDPWEAANSRIASTLQDIAEYRGRARAAWYEHDDARVRSEHKAVVRSARRLVALAEFLAGE